MPTTLPFSGARIPNQNEAGDPSADFARFGGDIDDKMVLKATSQSDRDTKYASVTAGTLVSCAALKTVWMKTTTPPTAAAWATLAEIGAAVTTGIGIGRSGFSINSQWGQRLNGIIYWRTQITWSGGTISAGGNGDLSPDVLCFTLNSAYLPAANVANWPIVVVAHTTTGAGRVESNGDVYISSLTGGGSISSGQTVTIGTSYPGV